MRTPSGPAERRCLVEKADGTVLRIRRRVQEEPESLPVVLARTLNRRELEKPDPAAHLRQLWDEAVGPEIAGRTRVLRLAGGWLHVEVEDEALRYELESFHQDSLCQSLRASGLHRLRRLRFHGAAGERNGEGGVKEA